MRKAAGVMEAGLVRRRLVAADQSLIPLDVNSLSVDSKSQLEWIFVSFFLVVCL